MDEWMLKVIPNFNKEMESVTDDRSMSGRMWPILMKVKKKKVKGLFVVEIALSLSS